MEPVSVRKEVGEFSVIADPIEDEKNGWAVVASHRSKMVRHAIILVAETGELAILRAMPFFKEWVERKKK